jgi:hypothetical protein
MIPGVLFGISIKFSSHGTILWNLEDRAFCGPNGAVPYTRNENNPIPGVAGGTLIEKIGEDATDSFIIGESREIQPPQSGRLYLGINEDRTSDNEGVFRAWVKDSYK